MAGSRRRVGLTVAVTGLTGDIGVSAVTALEREPLVRNIVGMARGRFDPSSYGWAKTTYRQGDILDRGAVEELVADADIVIHLASVGDSREESERVNLQGARNVFESTVAAQRALRLVYMSSVAAYGFHGDDPAPLTEDVPTRGSDQHYYSAQKSACEAALAEITAGSSLRVFVLRSCVVTGPEAPALADAMPWNRLPAPVRALVKVVPLLKPVVPDSGFPMQLVHHDDVASAIALTATAPVPPGTYNIAGKGLVTISEVAEALGGRPVRIPAAAASAASAAIAHLPSLPSILEWLHVAKASVEMDTSRAQRELGWRPTHTSAEALAALASAV